MITGVLSFPHSHSLPELLLPDSMNRNQLMCSFVPGFPQRLNHPWNLWVCFSCQVCEVKPSEGLFQATRKMRLRATSFYFIIIFFCTRILWRACLNYRLLVLVLGMDLLSLVWDLGIFYASTLQVVLIENGALSSTD